jgi:D-alanyl-D-alanine carboxypeptidase (penicillin-binding protein 5/6)
MFVNVMLCVVMGALAVSNGAAAGVKSNGAARKQTLVKTKGLLKEKKITAELQKSKTSLAPQELEAALPPPQTPYATLPLDIDVAAKQVYLVDAQTGAVLLDRGGAALMHPSSMTKIMTAYVAFRKIRENATTLQTRVKVGHEGWRVEGSSMFLNINDDISVQDLLRGLIVQSGNDASVILATHLAGSEAAFAMEMTRLAHEIGATQSTFINASGLPHENHQTTARDLATISLRLMRDFPEEYKIFGEKEFVYGNIKQGNRNPLLYNNIGCLCDGVKTGHSSIAGYGMVASCLQENQRLILVINGLPSMQARADEAKKIMTWGMRTFTNTLVFKAQELIASVPVWYGAEAHVPLTVEKDVLVTVPRMHAPQAQVKIHYPSALQAPLYKGDAVGKIIITAPSLNSPIEVPLVSAVTVEPCGFWGRIRDSLTYMLRGHKAHDNPA